MQRKYPSFTVIEFFAFPVETFQFSKLNDLRSRTHKLQKYWLKILQGYFLLVNNQIIYKFS